MIEGGPAGQVRVGRPHSFAFDLRKRCGAFALMRRCTAGASGLERGAGTYRPGAPGHSSSTNVPSAFTSTSRILPDLSFPRIS